MAAIFTIDQPSGAGLGSPGVARDELWYGQLVTFTALPAGSYLWLLLDRPPGSVATLSSSNTQITTLMQDLPGSYRVQLITNGGGVGNVMTKIAAAKYDAAGILVNRGWRTPAFDEHPDEANFAGNARGYAPAWEFIIADILANAFTGGGGSTYQITNVLSSLGAYLVVLSPSVQVIAVDTDSPGPGNPITVTVPAIAPSGTVLLVKDSKGKCATNGNAITVASAALIDGQASVSILINYGSVTLVFNGTEWNVI